VGDIGQKIGYNSIDNGYLRFNEFRVPRKALLSRFISIDKEGDFKMKADPRLIYQIMSQTRLMIIFGSGMNLFRASLFATRYAVCRR
jgi:acyl-CoA oxidase